VIFEQLKSQNELALHRRESLEKKSLDLSAFAGAILGIISYGAWGIGHKITPEDPICASVVFLILSIFFNLGTVFGGKVYTGLVPSQLDELDSWKRDKTFDKIQLYKRLIEEYGTDCIANDKLRLQRWFWHSVGTLSFVTGLTSIALIFIVAELRVCTLMLLVISVVVIIILYCYCRYYRPWIEDFNTRDRRFKELINSENWKKLASANTQ